MSMAQQLQFSVNTRRYLNRYYEILDEMIAGMTAVELTDSISHNFIVQMIPHHRAAIEMSKNLLQYHHVLPPLQKIASNIISEQTKSIANMEAALETCSKLENTGEDLCLYQRQFRHITQIMFSEMEQAPVSNNISANFMYEMIPHHRGAVRMSRNALHFPICPELVPILQAIITSQLAGIRQMELLLRRV